MWDVICKTTVTFLIIYAVIDIIIRVFNYFTTKDPFSKEDVFIIIKVCNQEKNLEQVVRGLVWKNLALSRGGYIPKILIVDEGSDDETRFIGERLSDDYSFIYYTTKDEYDKFKDTFTF